MAAQDRQVEEGGDQPARGEATDQSRRLAPEDHIHRLNEENARRRKENEALRARIALLEGAARRRALGAARHDALAASVRVARQAGKAVDAEKLSEFVESGLLALDVDLEADVVVNAEGEAELKDQARQRLEAAMAGAVELAARETAVVPPLRPASEPPAVRGEEGRRPADFSNAWDTPQAVSATDRGRKELRDAALLDEDVREAIDRL